MAEYFVTYQALVGAVIGALLASLITLIGTRYYLKRDKTRAYIKNAQNVMLTLCTQINKLENYKSFYEKHRNDKSRHLTVTSLLISDSEWLLLSKTEITQLNLGKEEMVNLIYELIRINDNFRQLVDTIHDHKIFREPIESTAFKGDTTISDEEESELKRLLDAIYERLEKIEILEIANKLHSFFKLRYPCEIFPQPIIPKN